MDDTYFPVNRRGAIQGKSFHSKWLRQRYAELGWSALRFIFPPPCHCSGIRVGDSEANPLF
jgi:hypothetical protein